MNGITMSPRQFRAHLKECQGQGTVVSWHHATPAGVLQVEATPLGIFKAEFVDNHHQPAVAQQPPITHLMLVGTPFQVAVWQKLLELAPEQLVSYQEVARCIGHPKAHRAVANAVGANKISYFVPCHQVIRSDGSLGGYRWGVERKRMLLTSSYRSL